jgi:hypothetical protein
MLRKPFASTPCLGTVCKGSSADETHDAERLHEPLWRTVRNRDNADPAGELAGKSGRAQGLMKPPSYLVSDPAAQGDRQRAGISQKWFALLRS